MLDSLVTLRFYPSLLFNSFAAVLEAYAALCYLLRLVVTSVLCTFSWGACQHVDKFGWGLSVSSFFLIGRIYFLSSPLLLFLLYFVIYFLFIMYYVIIINVWCLYIHN